MSCAAAGHGVAGHITSRAGGGGGGGGGAAAVAAAATDLLKIVA